MNTIKLASQLRYKAVQMSHYSKAAHLASSLSCIDILTILYEKILKINPKKKDYYRDRFILSKGHAAGALYATLAHKGFFSKKKLNTYGSKNSLLEEHPNPKLNGVEAPTGSLGHGLPIACGMALSAKILNLNYRTFVLLGDGECNEGTVWEATLFAAAKKLNNLVAVVDFNGWQGIGRTKTILNLNPFSAKWKSFGWNVRTINGHNHKQLFKCLKKKYSKPTVIIAKTVKGKGISFMEDDNNWHYRIPNIEEVKRAKKELGIK
jgi:transketolase